MSQDNTKYIIAGAAALALAGYVLWRNWPIDKSETDVKEEKESNEKF